MTTAGLAKAYGTIVTIDRGNFKLRLFKGLKLSKTYGVAVGMPAYPTPTGRFTIANKAVNPAWTAPNSPWAGAYANETVAGRLGREPAEGALDGDRQRRGHPRHRRAGLDRHPRSHGCIRMTRAGRGRPVPPRPGRDARADRKLTRIRPGGPGRVGPRCS